MGKLIFRLKYHFEINIHFAQNKVKIARSLQETPGDAWRFSSDLEHVKWTLKNLLLVTIKIFRYEKVILWDQSSTFTTYLYDDCPLAIDFANIC